MRQGDEADLINFDFNLHGEVCVQLANKYGAEFRLSREAGKKEATVRRPWR